MKKYMLLSAIMFVFAFTINAQNDTMYVMKAGVVVGKYNVNTQVDSVIFYQPQPATSGTFTDSRDGNLYKWVKVGTQAWMAENLKYLPNVVSPATGTNTDAYYYVYGYNGTDVATAKATANYGTYGVLYNWHAAMNQTASSTANPSGVQGVCPTGWHMPGDAEWTQLATYLGGESVAGGKLKETGATHWSSPNTDATNEIGFTALPGGYRSSNGTFSSIGDGGFWWSTTEVSWASAWYRYMGYNGSNVYSYETDKEVGFSVRCLRD